MMSAPVAVRFSRVLSDEMLDQILPQIQSTIGDFAIEEVGSFPPAFRERLQSHPFLRARPTMRVVGGALAGVDHLAIFIHNVTDRDGTGRDNRALVVERYIALHHDGFLLFFRDERERITFVHSERWQNHHARALASLRRALAEGRFL